MNATLFLTSITVNDPEVDDGKILKETKVKDAFLIMIIIV